MFRAQQNAFDEVVGKSQLMISLESPVASNEAVSTMLIYGCYSQGDRREPHFGKLGIHYGCLRQSNR